MGVDIGRGGGGEAVQGLCTAAMMKERRRARRTEGVSESDKHTKAEVGVIYTLIFRRQKGAQFRWGADSAGSRDVTSQLIKLT